LRSGSSGHLGRPGWLKGAAWSTLGLMVRGWRIGFVLSGRVRNVDTIIYKADRLGDWLLAGPAIERIGAAVRARGGTVLVWAAREGDALRRWRPPQFEVESIALEPSGILAKARRALAVARILARHRARAFVCLRHSPEPIRDFVLAHVEAGEKFALSWLIYNGPTPAVPHEIVRHGAILGALGIPLADARDLLPRIGAWAGGASRHVVLAPFSSAALKDWRDDGWRQIIALLVQRGLQVDVWAGPDQRPRVEVLLSGQIGAVAKAGTLADLAGAIAAARLVVTVDTVTAHLAAAMDAPMVCVLGGGQYGDFGPWQTSPRQRWVTQPLPCYGCDWRCTRPSVECLVTIPSSRIASEVEAALGGSA
jgi:hypothetical protein